MILLIEYERAAIRNLAILASKQYKSNLDKTLDLTYFISELMNNGKNQNPDFQGTNRLYKNQYPRTIRIAPPVKEILKSLNKIDSDIKRIRASDLPDDDKNLTVRDMIRDAVKPKQVITINHPLPIWWGDTLKGINLRIGFINNDRSKNFPFHLGGNQVHALAGGNTGEGKSVVMNAMLTALLTEYPPWELQLFMNDMKMLEYARYNMNFKCPQIRNIAITGSSTYLISVLGFIDEEMKKLYTVATTAGANTLEGLRNYLDLYIPRVLCVTDEYSQLPENATAKEKVKAEGYIQSIAKLGRAIGYHLILTTQNFSGALPGSTLGQFKVGICVGANTDNSESIIGNDAAVELTKKIGYCIVNQNRATGDKADNIEYKVAFIDDKTDAQKQEFQDILKRVANTADKLQIAEKPTAFNETTQTNITEFKNDLGIITKKAAKVAKKRNLNVIMPFLLGDGTRYSDTGSTKEYFIWDAGRNSNLFVNASEISDIKYLLHLIGDNFKANPEVKAVHKMIIDNPELFEDNYVDTYTKDLTSNFDTLKYLTAVKMRVQVLKYNLKCESESTTPTAKDFVYFVASSENNTIIKEFLEGQQQLDIQALEKTCECSTKDEVKNLGLDESYELLIEKTNFAVTIINFVNFFEKTQSKAKGPYLKSTDFTFTVFWVFSPNLNEGITKRDSITAEFNELLTNGPMVGVIFILVFDTPRDCRQTLSACKHILTVRPSQYLELQGAVEFSDTSGICCKYTEYQGDLDSTFYFKKYLSV